MSRVNYFLLFYSGSLVDNLILEEYAVQYKVRRSTPYWYTGNAR